MTRFLVAALLFGLLTALFGLRSLSGMSRRRFVAADLFTTAVVAALYAASGVIPVEFPAPTILALFVLLKLFVLILFLSGDRDARWDAATASAFTFFAFILLMPFGEQTSLDGDEPYYLLISESIVEDFDVDLRNQYATLASSPVGRTDLHPQPDDPVGPEGQRYSRHEPLMALLLAPGFAIAGVKGALVTMAIFSALLARSFVRLLEEEGISRPTSVLTFAVVMFTPPVITYGTRIWPEVPAAWLLIEAIRGLRQRRLSRFVLAIAGLVLLKLRFVAVAAVLIALLVVRSRRPGRAALGAMLLLLVPFGVLWWIKGHPLGVHGVWELMPREPWRYARGVLGLVLDGAGGIAFQAPFMLLGLFALSRWREAPQAARIAAVSAAPYIALLTVRDEWHGGWSPPLRYVVFLVPFLGLAAARALDGKRFGALPQLLTAASAFLSLHAIAYPWRLFRIANGENFVGEWLSRLHHADFSRLFPSFIRLNGAAWIAAILLLMAMITARWWLSRAVVSSSPLIPALLALLVAIFATQGGQPGPVVHLEDAHVARAGGKLEPPEFTVARFRFDGAWRLAAGESASFLFAGGPSLLRYQADGETEIDIAGTRFLLPPTTHRWGSAEVTAPLNRRMSLKVVRGSAMFDRIEARR